LTRRVAQDIGARRDELADLGKGFDYMATQLQSLVENQQHLMTLQQRLLHDVSHELRSLLTLARLEAGVSSDMDGFVDIRLLLQTLTASVEFEALALQRRIQFIHDLPDEGYLIPGNAELLYRALENLLRNAIHHTPPISMVLLRVLGYASPKVLKIYVEDQGTTSALRQTAIAMKVMV
jgi:two-component system OmpR family sensor kinase